MHELQVTTRILDIVLRHARANSVSKVLSIQLTIGALSELEDEWIQKYFDYLSKDTLAENAKLKIERPPANLKCEDCGHTFEGNLKEEGDRQCPSCGGGKYSIIGGNDYYVKDMEVI